MTSPTCNEEREPLLSPIADDFRQSTNEERPLLSHDEEQASESEPPSRSKTWRWLTRGSVGLKDFLLENPILICTFCLQFCFYFAKHIIEVPSIKLFEQAICNRYYDRLDALAFVSGQPVDEHLCKIPPIQNELANLTGLKFTFDALPGLLTALYYGSVADRFGRRLVLALCCAGTLGSLLWILLICYNYDTFPVRLVWASSIFLCVGGSQRVAKGMNFTIVADTVDKSHR